MASLAAGIVDPTKAGKYPVVLSDALLGKDPKEVYTGVRYNHKPSLSSSTAPHQARIKPASSSNKSTSSASYDLSFQDDGGRYAYNGSRGHEDGQYVLIFDPERQVFVLHKVDSTFNMNLVRTPENNDPESLRREYPQLEKHRDTGSGSGPKPPAASSKSKAAKGSSGASKEAPKARKPAAPKQDKKKAAASGLVVPEKKTAPPKPSPAPKATTNNNNRKAPKKAADSEEDESSDDDLLTIEDPGGAAPSANRDFSPGFMDKPLRRFSEFVQQQNEEEDDEDADGEDDDDDAFEHFTLPSPINRQMQQGNSSGSGAIGLHESMPVDDARDQEDEDEEIEMEDVGGGSAEADEAGLDEMDLEAALMAELGEGSDKESDVSEEE
ncbi:Uu.00g112410.m01.CDS01 [Anthostomella pinea]|uniref:Uu.00g112410.m01.CDS01 n=1 Tax=Anthostomella pinea TaxID=933095 RepID=A0AAI8VA44_9PEZI|nr:Uu.00g112410.m01.CDS01 [Anthostomella pinea]